MFIEVTAIDAPKEKAFLRQQQQAALASGRSAGRVVEFDEDDLEQPLTRDPDEIDTPTPPPPPAGEPPAGVYWPCTIFLSDIREMYPRKGGAVGTRIIYRSGAFRLVRETYDEVKAKVVAAAVIASTTFVPAPRSRSR